MANELIQAGATLATIAFNLAQKVGEPITQEWADNMQAAQKAWDAESAGAREQHDRDSRELRSLCQARDGARRQRDLLSVEVAAVEASVGHLGRLVDELRPGHELYQYLRDRPLDAMHLGGVFAGQTPDNLVLNGEDLDAAILDAIRSRTPSKETGADLSGAERKMS